MLDVAFASEASGGGFDKITRPLIERLGPRLAAWVDHHDHVLHASFASDPRFILATKAEHGACPEMITPDLVERVGHVDTIVCHGDFDGLSSAAKWMRGGVEPYPGADDDARAIDTRIGTPSPTGARFDRAIRANPRDTGLMGVIVRHLASGLSDASLWEPIDQAARAWHAIEQNTRALAQGYDVSRSADGKTSVAVLVVPPKSPRYDKTGLLLDGQERADVAVLVDRDTLTLAAPFDSGRDFLAMLGLSGGMPTLVSVPTGRARDAFIALGLDEGEVDRLASRLAPG